MSENAKCTSFNRLDLYCNLSLLATAIITGLSFVAQKLGMDYVEPFTFNALRCLIGFLCLLPIIFIYKLFAKNTPKYSNTELYKGGVIAGCILFTALSINQYCMVYSDAGKAGFITTLYILFVPIITVFLKQKLKINVQIGIVVALIGLYLLCGQGLMQFRIWDGLLVVSAFFFALHIITLSHYSKKANTLKLANVQFLTAGSLSIIPMFIFEHPEISNIIAGWQPILFIGVVVTGVAYTLQIFGQKATNPVVATLILSSESVFAVLGGIALLDETLTIRETAGCIVMLAAIVISQIQFKKICKRSRY